MNDILVLLHAAQKCAQRTICEYTIYISRVVTDNRPLQKLATKAETEARYTAEKVTRYRIQRLQQLE